MYGLHRLGGAVTLLLFVYLLLTILLVALTQVFLMATVTSLPYALYAIASAPAANVATTPITITAMAALPMCLIPTTNGGLLSAIGVAA